MAVKQKLVWYRARVTDGASTALVFCEVYNPHGIGTRGAEFHVVSTSFPPAGLTIPSGRQATFQEELRVLGTAARVVAGSNDEVNWIKTQLGEAFGAASSVDLLQVT